MRFVGDSSSEIDAVSERKKSPQAINQEWSPIGVTNRFDEGAGCRIVVRLCSSSEAISKVEDLNMSNSPTRNQCSLLFGNC
jgi:hypothetical protein